MQLRYICGLLHQGQSLKYLRASEREIMAQESDGMYVTYLVGNYVGARDHNQAVLRELRIKQPGNPAPQI